MTALYPPDWRPRQTSPGVLGGRNPARHAALLLLAVTNGVTESGKRPPVGVYPSKGARGTVAQWDAFTSGCDARSLLVLALGGAPNSLGLSEKSLPSRVWLPRLDDEAYQIEPIQLALFEAAA